MPASRADRRLRHRRPRTPRRAPAAAPPRPRRARLRASLGHGPLSDRTDLGRRRAHLVHPQGERRARVPAAGAAPVPPARPAPRAGPRERLAVAANGSTPLTAAILLVSGIALVVITILVLRSRRARARLYELDAQFRGGPAEPDVFIRRFELGIYCAMCFGLALALLGLVVAAT